MILLNETWSDENQTFELEGYVYIDMYRRYRHRAAKRASDGIGIFIRNNIFKKGIDIYWAHDDIIVWLKVKNNFFGLEKNVLLGIVYITPENSTYNTDDPYSILYNKISMISENNDTLICRDFNSRTSNMTDYIKNSQSSVSDGDLATLLPDNNQRYANKHFLEHLHMINNLKRVSKDAATPNIYRNHLLNFWKSNNFFILNGCIGQDKGVDDYTRVDTTGSSVVDYLLATPPSFTLVRDFCIHTKFPELDHLPISFSTECQKALQKKNYRQASQWYQHYRYVWDKGQLGSLEMALTDDVSVPSYEAYMASICNLEDTNTIASNYGKYFSQACHRIFLQKAGIIRKRTGPLWFDAECRSKRIEAITAGKNVMDEADRLNPLEKRCEFRAIKQRKHCAFQQNCMRRIDDIYEYNQGELWKEFNKLLPTGMNTNMPSGDEFFEHFESMSQTKVNFLFDYSYEETATKWLENEKAYPIHPSVYLIEFDILNRNFTEEEIKFSISSLKDNKSAGIDSLPAEFFKVSNGIISRHITKILNYIITTREFPEIWTTGLRSAIHKAGLKLNTKNYRGITITVLPVFEKIFKIAVQRCLEFISDAFDKTDRYNGGFLKGSRTSDNIYVLNSIIERQLTLGQNLIVCHVDFSRAFDSINRNILFY